MSSHVILTFFPCIVFSAVNPSPRSVAPCIRTAAREGEGEGFDLLCFLHSVSLKGFGQQMILGTEGEKCVSHLLLLRVISVIYSLLVRSD